MGTQMRWTHLLMARNCHSCRAETGDTAGGEGWGGGPAQLAGCGTAGAACVFGTKLHQRQLRAHVFAGVV